MKNFITLCSLSLFTFSASAFTLTSSSNSSLKGWASKTITLNVNTSNCPSSVDVVGLIKSAVAVWNNVPTSSIKVSYGESTTSTTYSDPTTVYCETNFNSITSADEDFVPAAANSQKTGDYITSGLLVLNVSSGSANIANYDSSLLTIIVAHEIGHILGLGHSETTNALMYYDATYKKTLKLAQDDMDGISYLYPSDELSDHKFAGCGLVKNNFNSNTPSGPTKNILLLILLLCAPILLALKQRRKYL